ncbi:MAG: ABC transporter substrate-binding protein [Bacteroidaceae bacterium]|nr:ABC transporter substrate-binding protein [Bacteroidaceae bacterium]
MNRFRHILTSLFIVTAFCSCNRGQEAQTAPSNAYDSLTIRLAVLPTADCLPFYYAKEEGLFDSLGIKVKLKTYRAAMDADTAFLGTTADAIWSDMVKACIWKSGGDSVSVVMQTQLDLYLMTAYSARIRQISSLKEKIIGITRNSAVDLVADQILSRAKFLSTDLNKPQINNIKLRCYMVDQNQYDGALLPEPYASECEARGARRVIGTPELGLNLSAVIMKDSVLARHKENIPKLKQAYDIAARQLNQLIISYDSLKTDTVLMASKDAPQLLLMKYIPQSRSIEIPDTLVKFPKFLPASVPTDSAFTQAKRWCQGRTLLKKDIKKEDLYAQ